MLRVKQWFAGIRVRIVVGYLVLIAVALAVAVIVTRQVQYKRIEREVEQAMHQEVEELRRLADIGVDPATAEPFGDDVASIFDTFLARNVPSDDEAFYTLVDRQPHRPSQGAPELFTVEELVDVWAAVVRTTRIDRETDLPIGEVRSLAVPLSNSQGVAGVFVVTAFPDREQREVDQTVRVIALTGLGVLAITGALAWSIAGRILRPVRQLTETARGITDSDLSGRIPVEGHDELAELGHTFNDMVGRLDASFEHQRRFLDDVAHELRTPITIAQGHLETVGTTPDERAETVAIVSDELDRMGRYVSDLLLLAKAERPDFLRLGPVDLGDLALTLQQRVRAIAERRWVLDQAPAPGAIAIVADQDRLEQAIVNLAANAADHTSAGDEIGVGVRADGTTYLLWVRDTGPGIDSSARQGLFNRYTRGATSRGSRPDGMGIGLSIVDAIARAHGGHARATSEPGAGATFMITLPSEPPGFDGDNGVPDDDSNADLVPEPTREASAP